MMKKWLVLSILLSSVGFFKEYRPSQPFLFEYLTGEAWRNLSSQVIMQDIYPIASYSYLPQLIITLLITDISRHTPLLFILGLSGSVMYALLIWTESMIALQVVEVLYSTTLATELAYYTYIYTQVTKEKYLQVTGNIRAGVLFGKFCSGITGQLLISFECLNYKDLHYLSFGAFLVATFLILMLPPSPKSVYLDNSNTILLNTKEKCNYGLRLFTQHLVESYSSSYVLKWSLWWGMALCGYIVVQNYSQPLWKEINPNRGNRTYNGAVKAIRTLFELIGTLSAGYLNINWKKNGEIYLTICSLISAAILYLASQTENIFVAYSCSILFGTVFHFMITIASSEIAKNINEDSYGVIFGINTIPSSSVHIFLIATFIKGLKFSPRYQFVVFGSYYVFISIIFATMAIVERKRLHKRKRTYSQRTPTSDNEKKG